MPADDDDYLWSGSGPADPDVARLEQQLAPLCFDPVAHPLDEVRVARAARGPKRGVYLAIAAAIAAVAAVLLLLVARGGPAASPCASGPGVAGFTFTGIGDVTCGGAAVTAGTLPVGGTLDTGTHEANLSIASIGTARLGPETRVRLDTTSAGGHHLSLERGSLHARVNAPPRLFAVTTPGAEVTDLGCEYEMSVDATGAGSIHVLSGKVELATAHDALVVVPAGTHASLLAGHQPGLPVIDAPGAALAAAVRELEAHSTSDQAVANLLAVAEPRDAITVVTLAALARDPGRRRTVLARLALIWPAPSGITLDDAEDPAMFELWRDDVVLAYQTFHVR